MKYEFHIGDYVEMKAGGVGYISKMQPLSNGHTCLYVHFTDNKIYPYINKHHRHQNLYNR